MNLKDNQKTSTITLARNLAQARISTSKVSAKLGGAQRESLLVQLSTEATRLASGSGEERPQQILAGLNTFMMSVSLEEKKPEKKVTRRKISWTPTARVGQVKEGLSVMGRLKITDQVDDQSDSSNSVSISLKSNGNSTDLSVSMGSSNSHNGPRIQGGEALHNLMKNGLVADGLKSLLDSDKQGSTQSGVKSLTVRTNGTGRQKVLSLTDAGSLAQNTRALGAFQVLDGKPILKKPMDVSHIYQSFSGGKTKP